MKIAIVIPLKAKKVASNWQTVESRLFTTLNSITRQTDKRYCVCVVGHDRPTFLSVQLALFERIKFVQFDDFLPPKLCSNSSKNQEKFEKDRCAKIFKGYQYLISSDPDITHLFPLDADDLIHEEFVNTLVSLNKLNYIIENGYFYYLSSKLLNKTSAFSTYCGSSAILSRDFIQHELKTNERFIFTHVGHVSMRAYLSQSNIEFHIPKKRLVMYVRDNGENISRLVKGSTTLKIKRNIKKWFKAITLLHSDVLKKFGVESQK